MGLFDFLFGKTREAGQQQQQIRATRVETGRQPAYAVIDVKTTGLSPKTERIIELAIARVDSRGDIVDEFVQRFKPEGPVGATHIHGISDADVRDQPLFSHV